MTMNGYGTVWMAAAAGLLPLLAAPSRAQSQALTEGPSQGATTRAAVTKIDRAGHRVTLKHAEIKNLDMPPMTMIFHVADASTLQGVEVGDRVRFTAARIEGRYTVTGLSKAP